MFARVVTAVTVLPHKEQHVDENLESTDVETVVEEDALVEDVSIDGMCGVY